MATDIGNYFDFHSDRAASWTKAFDEDLKKARDNIKWVHECHPRDLFGGC